MLKKMIIKINGLYLAGITDEQYKSSFKGVGNYDQKCNHVDYLKFVYDRREAKVIEGERNLKSWFDKLFQYSRDKKIEFNKIEIFDLDYLNEKKTSLEHGLINTYDHVHVDPSISYKTD